ncbi:kinesin-like protein KIF6-like protein [Cricetulus griseus]|uniref:Kinesin-like protein n=1 Tax=Cricetulus griseus TaxID=10029 RepID=A0A061IRG1_CRIGR|nr:kinesin-like protein KIF6-like protein [Cricetulus griseus]
MNQASTRSHCIFTIHLTSKEPGSATVRHAKLHLVDLAGSERVAKTGVGGLLLTEAKYINLSLHYLEQESISTCRFAQRVALIKNEAVLNEEIDPRLMIIRLQKEISDLKTELAMATGEWKTEELSKAELLQLEKLIASFLEDQDPESRLEVGADMRKIHHCFHHFKKLLNDKNTMKNTISSETTHQACQEPLKDEEYTKLRDLLKQRDNEIRATKSLIQISDILVNMLKKEKKKTQDALHLSSKEMSETRTAQNSPFIPKSPAGQSTAVSSALYQAQDLSTCRRRSSLLHKKTASVAGMSCLPCPYPLNGKFSHFSLCSTEGDEPLPCEKVELLDLYGPFQFQHSSMDMIYFE